MAHAVSALVLLSLVSLGNAQPNPTVISVSNGSPWGSWGRVDWCPSGHVARGFSTKAEPIQGRGDDTAVNGIQLHCAPRSGVFREVTIRSAEGKWGSWSSAFWCPDGYLISFSLKVEQQQGDGDDTAVNNIKFKCSSNNIMEGSGLPWGTYGSWSKSCLKGICGIRTKVEPPQGDGDDTALNDVEFYCCQ